MTEEQNKLSTGRKIWTVSGIIIVVLAFAYQAYGIFSKDTPVTGGDYGSLTTMAVMFIVMITSLQPVFKKW